MASIIHDSIGDAFKEQLNSKPNSAVPFKKFLEEFPLGSLQLVSDVGRSEFDPSRTATTRPPRLELIAPGLRIWCANPDCKGVRNFTGKWSTTYLGNSEDLLQCEFITYTCRDCQVWQKVYCLGLRSIGSSVYAIKVGEVPELHIDLPSNLPGLLGPGYGMFIKGLKAEKRGLGIGAFTYYRRVVENQKNRFVEKIIDVAIRLNAREDVVKGLKRAVTETQFTKAVALVKDFVPEVLLVEGRNPLTLLHDALSAIGVHGDSDEKCLQCAHDIRVILEALAVRMKDALQDDNELSESVKRVLQTATPPKVPLPMSQPAAQAALPEPTEKKR